jgi:hypothetical protein
MAEIELGVLQKQCLDRRVPNINILKSEVQRWAASRNAQKCRINWQFSTQDSRIKLKRLYPSLDS